MLGNLSTITGTPGVFVTVYSNNRFHQITDLEFILFEGSPAVPEPVFGRSGANLVEKRTSSRPRPHRRGPCRRMTGLAVGTVVSSPRSEDSDRATK